jgi:chemotaxis methyl-accepting protein methylase
LTATNLFRAAVQPLTETDFAAIRALAKTACGIDLHHGKKALVSSRIEKLVRGHGFESFTEYIRFVTLRKHGPEFTEFIDTLTTNHSGFWREPEHFIFLQNTVFQQHRGTLRIWSAACATGEEPYTLAMCALSAGAPCSIAASDISTAALRTAVRGEYEESRGCRFAGRLEKQISHTLPERQFRCVERFTAGKKHGEFHGAEPSAAVRAGRPV